MRKEERIFHLENEFIELIEDYEESRFESDIIALRENIKKVIMKGVNKELKTVRGKSILDLSIEKQDEDLLSFLVEIGTNVNVKDELGNTPLMKCLQKGLSKSLNLIKILLPESDIEMENDEGKTILNIAVERNLTDIIYELILYNADIEHKDKYGNFPLLIACKNNQEKIVAFLLNLGVQVNNGDEKNRTPLHESCKRNNEKIVVSLLNSGGDPNVEDVNGVTPLMICAEQLNYSLIKILLLYGNTDINYINKNNETVLYKNMMNNNVSMIEYLVEKGANIN